MKQFEGEGYLVLLNILAAMRVEVVYFFLELRQVDAVFGEEAF